MDIRSSRIALAAVLLLCSMPGFGQSDGLSLRSVDEPWPRLQARVSLAVDAPVQPALAPPPSTPGLRGGRILGDLYFGGQRDWGVAGLTGSFRATSGLLWASRGVSLSQPSVPLGGQVLSVSQLALSSPAPDAPAHGTAYLGVGYTGLSPKGGWGFTADVGVLAGNGSGLRPVHPVAPEDSSFRLTPVLQLGVSYSF